MKKRIFISILLLVVLIYTTPVFADENVSGEVSGDINLLYEKIADEYLETNKETLIEAAKEIMKMNGDEVLKYYEVAKPFYIYDFTDIESAVFNYPLYNEGDIKSVISIIVTDNGMADSCSEEYVKELNEINYLKEDVVVYMYNGKVIFENEETTVEGIGTDITTKENRDIIESDYEKFINLEFDEKLEKYNNMNF